MSRPPHEVSGFLCRLPPDRKFSFHCKCVSKLWLSLLSDPYFAARFRRLQLDDSKAIITTLTLWNANSFERTITSNTNPVFNTVDFSLSFLPCYPHRPTSRVMLGVHKDLLLCCKTKFNQSDYYICNPYTKKWFALPPPPHRYPTLAHVGFIVLELEGQDSNAVTIPSFQMLSISGGLFGLLQIQTIMTIMLIFSSETREWRELVVPRPGRILSFYHYTTSTDHYPEKTGPVAYNGMLYWLCQDGSTFVLNPFTTSSNITIAKCCLRKKPDQLKHSDFGKSLDVCGGRLQMCVVTGWYPDPITVWELKEEIPEDNTIEEGRFKWIVKRISFPFGDSPFLPLWLLSFYPNNENIIWLELRDDLIMCKLCGNTLRLLKITDDTLFLFVLPGWPTPVPRQQPKCLAMAST